MTEKTWEQIQTELARPFAADEIEWKPQATNKNDTRALAVAYINARAVMDRLDAVVGAGNWQDNYRVLPNGKNVECALTIDGVTKVDVGEPNEGGYSDLFKSAYSDALKRAAVKFGIGRYLYNLPTQWVSCKPQGKSVVLTETPKLPDWAMPDGKGKAPKQQAPAKRQKPQAPASNGSEKPFYGTVATKIPYFNHAKHVKSTGKLLSLKYPETGQEAALQLELYGQYAKLRADGVEQDEAVARVKGEAEPEEA